MEAVAKRTLTFNAAEQFGRTPGPRLREHGEFSGQEFREEHLRPLLEQARSNGVKLIVDLDGAAGYATSFLEEAFGGLAREFGSQAVSNTLELKSNDEPYLVDEILTYIRNANK